MTSYFGSEAPPHSPPASSLPVRDLKTPFDRKIPNPKEDQDLLESVRSVGVLTPIHVAKDLTVLAGNRRVAAARKLFLEFIPGIVHEDIVDVKGMTRFTIHTDTQCTRNKVESAHMALQYQAQHGMTADQAAKQLGMSPAGMSRASAICKAHPDVQAALARGEISLPHLIVLKPLGDQAVEFLPLAKTLAPDALKARIFPKKRGGKPKPVVLSLAGVQLSVPADMACEALMDSLRTKLFAACSKAGALGLGVDSVQKILSTQGR